MKVYLKESPIHGRGVFASHLILQGNWSYVYGDIRELLPGDPLEKYGVDWENDLTFIPYAPWCCCNHSPEPNCEISKDTLGVCEIYTLRDIPRGEELLLDYGYDPSED
jgi:SET domain-containing protein